MKMDETSTEVSGSVTLLLGYCLYTRASILPLLIERIWEFSASYMVSRRVYTSGKAGIKVWRGFVLRCDDTLSSMHMLHQQCILFHSL